MTIKFASIRLCSVDEDSSAENKYAALRRLGELGRAAEQRRDPDPYPRASGSPQRCRSYASGTRKSSGWLPFVAPAACKCSGRLPGERPAPEATSTSWWTWRSRQEFREQAGLRGDLEEMLHCPIHIATTGGLRYAREHTRRQIEQEAKPL